MDFGLGLRDVALALGIVGSYLTLRSNFRKNAADEAVRRNNIKRDIEDIRAEMLRLHKEDDEVRDFRKDVYQALRDIRDRLTRMEARQNGKH